MFDHAEIRVRDIGETRRFYRLALGSPTHESDPVTEWGDFGVAAAAADRPPSSRLHVGFGARLRAEVDGWWERLVAAGYTSDGEPGERPEYHASYYGAFVLDPDGNSVELVHHHTTRPELSLVDHLWLRATDVAETKRFYEAVAPAVGTRLVHDASDRARFTDGVGSFSFVAGDEPTRNVHLAFGVGSREAVRAFHAAAIGAGATDNGAPGERPQYHPGYYGAFVLDPDGNNVEAVFHDRL